MNIVTVYPMSGVHPDPFLMSIYDRLAANPPAGYEVYLHNNMGDLCTQAQKYGQMLQVFEIVAHGNPYSLGVVNPDSTKALAGALKSASPRAQVFLSGCNTGTYMPNDKSKFTITAYLDSMVMCEVFGSLGYLNQYTYADGYQNPDHQIQSTNDDGDGAFVYGGSVTKATGYRCFAEPPTRNPYVPMTVPYTGTIDINDPTLSTDARLTLTTILTQISKLSPTNAQINGRTQPNITVAYHGDNYDFYFDGSTIVQQSTNNNWRIRLTSSQITVLTTLWLPKPTGVAVVQLPVPTEPPKVQR